MKPWGITTALLGIGLLCAPAIVAAQATTPAQDQTVPPAQNYGEQNSPQPYAGQDYSGQYNEGQNIERQDSNVMPGPGTLNYVEGAVYLDGRPVGKNSVGNVQMAPGQLLETHQGKAEILLDPGIYLRVDDHSTVKMISPSLTPTQVEVQRGNVGVEVDQLLKQNVVQVINHGVTTQLVKTGYYEFNANDGRLRVFKGQAEVEYANNRWAKVKGGREMALVSGEKQQATKFQPDPQEDQLMAWSKLRSQYLAEANNQLAAQYYGAGFYPGWYWDPGMWGYTYLGWSPFYSPFGWGYYPFGWGGFGWGGGWYGVHPVRPWVGGRGFGGGFHGRIGSGFHGGHGH